MPAIPRRRGQLQTAPKAMEEAEAEGDGARTAQLGKVGAALFFGFASQAPMAIARPVSAGSSSSVADLSPKSARR